jgi:hypothetical protein
LEEAVFAAVDDAARAGFASFTSAGSFFSTTEATA